MATDIWGIDNGYEDARGEWRETPTATRSALLAAMNVDPGAPSPPAAAPVRVLRPGQVLPLQAAAELMLEDGTALRVGASLPPDLPLGYHQVSTLDGKPVLRLIVSPSQCYLPPGWHTWGWAVQLYALRSAESWGIGDLADLRHLGR
jgi:4-alpha-glucanotransferase